ncbi:MAG: hypothetical protein EF813_03620 [Methanosarcinales archaeon]|nr:MAG: hypothetical protein EF813_03620 [Methanosarcinales archaeon]
MARIDALLRRIGEDLQSHHAAFREELKKPVPRADLVNMIFWQKKVMGRSHARLQLCPIRSLNGGRIVMPNYLSIYRGLSEYTWRDA